MPARPIKTRAQNKLHRGCQQKLPQRRQHPVLAKQVPRHGQHQGGAQHQPYAHWPEARPGRGIHGIYGRAGCQRLIARIPHGAAQAHFHGRVAHLYPRRFGRQVHRGAFHAWHFFQSLFHPRHTRCASHAANADVDGCGKNWSSHGAKPRPCHYGNVKRITHGVDSPTMARFTIPTSTSTTTTKGTP